MLCILGKSVLGDFINSNWVRVCSDKVIWGLNIDSTLINNKKYVQCFIFLNALLLTICVILICLWLSLLI